MKWIDFLFWHYYCFFEQHKNKYFGDNRWQAILAIFVTGSFIIGWTLGAVNTFIHPLSFIPKLGTMDEKIWSLLFAIPIFIYLNYRYYRKKSIVKGEYKTFIERWGDSSHVTKKNMKILLVYTIISIVAMLIFAIILGELNRRKLLEGYCLFP